MILHGTGDPGARRGAGVHSARGRALPAGAAPAAYLRAPLPPDAARRPCVQQDLRRGVPRFRGGRRGRALRASAPGGLHGPRARLPEERQWDVQPGPSGALPRRDRVDRGRRALPPRPRPGARERTRGRAGREREGARGGDRGAARVENASFLSELSGLITLKLKLSPGGQDRVTDLLRSVEDPEVFADIAAFNLCGSVPVKQRLLETLDVNRRLVLLLQVLRSEIDAIVLQSKLQGGLANDRITRN